MKKLFYLSVLLLIAFEVLNVYFIMPMPGSQTVNSISIAYVLYSYRWIFRILFGTCLIWSFIKTWTMRRKWLRITVLVPLLAVIYLFNFVLVADKMFLQPKELILKNANDNTVPSDRLVLGVECNGEAKAYPIEYLAYHHQVQDVVGGKSLIVTYCSVCRTGRAFEPIVNGKEEKFRLVGMDHFNAMFEDQSTGSWWRQVNGEAVAGPLKGQKLPEFYAVQMSLEQWLKLYPQSTIMQPDPASMAYYDPDATYEKGIDQSALTGTNPESWQKKSWVIGIELGENSRAYDWNELEKKRVLNDRIGETELFIALATDGNSFAAFERPTTAPATLSGDTLLIGQKKYNFAGVSLDQTEHKLTRIRAYQEFWHSWETFHPKTTRYEPR